MTYADLPPDVRHGVAGLARKVRALGGRLFVFGSFATATARPNSDLDLAFELERPPSDADYHQLIEAAESLPTVRPVDFVNLNQTDQTFRDQLVRIEITPS